MPVSPDHLDACLALNLIPGLGPVRQRRLCQVFGSPAQVLGKPVADLCRVEGVGPDLARRIQQWEKNVDLADERRRMAARQVSAITPDCAFYPRLLRQIADPPPILYVWGQLPAPTLPTLAVVGTREPTFYGLTTARRLAHQLACDGVVLVSGLARGIDTVVHQASLQAKGCTYAILGCGLDQVYPPENGALAQRIVAAGGAILSELSMATRPSKQTFPMRNRLISGCSLGVMVIEASRNSGAMISADQALEQGRAVFAVPGEIDRPQSAGTNRLIQQGAKLVTEVDDVYEELGPQYVQPELNLNRAPGARVPTSDLPTGLLPVERAVWYTLDPTGVSLDQIVRSCGLPIGQVSLTLMTLESKKLVKFLSGRYYVITQEL